MRYRTAALSVTTRILLITMTMVCLWFLCRVAFGQQGMLKESKDRGKQQTIIIKDVQTKQIREFTRYGHTRYGAWIEHVPPYPRALEKSHSYKATAVLAEHVRKAIGTKLYDVLDRHRKVRKAGHFNLSGNPLYDQVRFYVGDTYTTKDMKRGRIPNALTGKQEVYKQTGFIL